MKTYKFTCITMHDHELAEVKALGVNITVTNGSQDQIIFKMELTEEQAKKIAAHKAIMCFREV